MAADREPTSPCSPSPAAGRRSRSPSQRLTTRASPRRDREAAARRALPRPRRGLWRATVADRGDTRRGRGRGGAVGARLRPDRLALSRTRALGVTSRTTAAAVTVLPPSGDSIWCCSVNSSRSSRVQAPRCVSPARGR
jgi:hypothetical protein